MNLKISFGSFVYYGVEQITFSFVTNYALKSNWVIY